MQGLKLTRQQRVKGQHVPLWLCLLYLQEAADRVLVEKLEGAPTPPGRLTTPLKLAGLDVTANMLLLHDGSRAQVYKINGSDSSLSLQSDFESPAVASVEDNSGLTDSKGVTLTTGGAVGCAMALYNDSVYRTADRRVEVCNLSGMCKGSLPCIVVRLPSQMTDCHRICKLCKAC